jgi:hypothetical protein
VQDDAVDCSKIKPKGAVLLAGAIDVARLCRDDYRGRHVDPRGLNCAHQRRGGEGRALYRAAVDADLEGIVAKRLADAYQPKRVRWHEISEARSQRRGRTWFRKRRYAGRR